MAIYPVKPTLEAVRPFVSSILVEKHAWENVFAVAGQLQPGAACHTLECRLSKNGRVDFLIAVPTGRASRIYAGGNSKWPVAPSLALDSRWDRVRRLFQTCNDGPLGRFSPNVWIEFDLDGTVVEPPAPQIGLCVHPELFHRRMPPRPPVTSAAFRDPTEQAISQLLGEPLDPRTLKLFRTCISEAEGPGREGVVHLGVMLSRHPRILRVGPQLAATRIPGYLERIGWHGPLEKVRFVLEELCYPRQGLLKVDIDLDGNVLLPKFGVCTELSVDGDYAAMWPIVDRLVELGVCTSEKGEALRPWPGMEMATIGPGNWPARIHRMLDLKFVVWPDGRLEAKAYLMIQPTFSVL